jgi:seryl-tRNA synthetase
MHDIKFIRENPSGFDQNLAQRNLEPLSALILELDEVARDKQTEIQQYQARRNTIAKEIAAKKAQKQDADDLIKEAEVIKQQLPKLEAELEEISNSLQNKLCTIPNLIADDVPLGKDAEDNVELRKIGEVKPLGFSAKAHFELGEALGMMDFEAAAKMSGSRFVVLKKEIAQLERALANFMLDHNTQKYGYEEIVPPYLVKDHAMFGVGQLPKFDEDSFKTREGFRLIPTAEVSLTNLVADSILNEEELPLRYTAYSPCFRSEAGSAGQDTRGMIRQHQFSKVELVSITRPQDSKQEHERMTECAESILKTLELPFRTILLCGGDMGFSSTKTYDIEVWLPSQGRYREISSCSNCGDFQARRMKARYKELSSRNNILVHTLNGSALAIGRTIVAILENYQNQDGSITIPEALRKYLNGKSLIKA